MLFSGSLQSEGPGKSVRCLSQRRNPFASVAADAILRTLYHSDLQSRQSSQSPNALGVRIPSGNLPRAHLRTVYVRDLAHGLALRIPLQRSGKASQRLCQAWIGYGANRATGHANEPLGDGASASDNPSTQPSLRRTAMQALLRSWRKKN